MTKNKVTAILLMLMFALTFIAPAAFASNINDVTGHWAEAQVKALVDQGIISGYPDGSFKPEGKITRAEFAAIIVKGFNLKGENGKVFSDTAQHWGKDSIATANHYGIVNGYSDTRFGPNDPITREQMAVMIVKAAELSEPVSNKTFADSQNISDWAKSSVALAVGNNIISGYPDNTFKPKGNATRAEAAVVINKSIIIISPPIIGETDYKFIDKPGTYGPATGTETVSGDVTVKAQNTVLQNLVIKGDLIIAKEVGDGDVTLNNIKVEGKTYIRGGGKDSIHINGGQYNEVIVEQTATGAVRIVAINSPGLQITIAENVSGHEVILNGNFKRVTVNADNVKISTQGDTQIDGLRVQSGLKIVNIELSQDTTVQEMMLNSKANIGGKGIINAAIGSKVKDSNFATGLYGGIEKTLLVLYTVTVDGVTTQIDSNVKLYEANGKLWAPVKFVVKALPLTAEWDVSRQQAVFDRGGRRVAADINSGNLVIKDNLTFVDLGYLSKEYGYVLSWDLDARTVSFTTISYTVTLDGVTTEVASLAPLYEENGKLWAPVVFVVKALPVDAHFDVKYQQDTFVRGGNSVATDIDSGTRVLKDKLSFVDLGYLCEGLGYYLSWDLDERTVSFTTMTYIVTIDGANKIVKKKIPQGLKVLR